MSCPLELFATLWQQKANDAYMLQLTNYCAQNTESNIDNNESITIYGNTH